ncbi:MAG TPA: growth inhibitor PemK [Bacteroidales bacterium]|jgi:mRNA interferase MazF|nr:growth inhibitor PemK [Bacteroidales bacterium]HBZ21719.1 growth inhibitor PemK [Bacteroidales bacterium]
MEAKQYQVIIVSPNDPAGKEEKRSSQCVIISPDEMNKFLKTLTIAPLTADSEGYPTRPKIKFNNKPIRVVLDQIMTIEKNRIIKTLGELAPPEIKKLKAVLKETFID